MTDSPTKKSVNRINVSGVDSQREKHFDDFKLQVLNEFHAQIMVGIFLVSAFTIVTYFNTTVITVLAASRWFAMLGVIGFVLLFLVRRRFRLSLLDGLLYNVFGTAPAGLALLLFLNAQCSESYTETYKILKRNKGGSGYTLTLENEALTDYWHIRNIDKNESNIRLGKIQYTFCNGVFGYQVMKGRDMTP